MQFVAVKLPIDYGYCRGIYRGITAYARLHHPSWTCFRTGGALREIIHGPRAPIGGIIGAMATSAVVAEFKDCGIPLVNVSGTVPQQPFAQVISDDWMVGKLGALHFIERGLRNFGFMGVGRSHYSARRAQGYFETIAQAGLACSSDQMITHDSHLPSWLPKLKKPCGVMAGNDETARRLLEACSQAGIRVPEEIAVLGVDNDDLIVDATEPPLSSVVLNTERIGFEAARLLNDLMNGQSAPASPIWVPPLGIAARRSSDIVAIEDAEVASAVRFIQAHAHEGIGVEDLLAEVPVSRKTLELRFRKVLGRCPAEEIRRVQMERAKALLAETNHSIALIASAAGFRNSATFARAFRSTTAMTPTTYRQSHRPR